VGNVGPVICLVLNTFDAFTAKKVVFFSICYVQVLARFVAAYAPEYVTVLHGNVQMRVYFMAAYLLVNGMVVTCFVHGFVLLVAAYLQKYCLVVTCNVCVFGAQYAEYTGLCRRVFCWFKMP
jgi:hypothetical protein